MSTAVPCPSCARDIMILSEDPRSALRCPACNFHFERPVPSNVSAAHTPEASAVRVGGRRRATTPAIVTCTQCGEPLRIGDEQPVRCPTCGHPVDAITERRPSPQARSKASQARPTDITVKPPRPAGVDGDDDEEEYTFAEPMQLCPNCHRDLADAAVVCVACGFNRETGETLVREYSVVDKTWEGALSYRLRLILFGAGEAFACLVLLGSILGGFEAAGVLGWLPATLLLAYVLGTFYQVHVTRTPGGQVGASKHWRFCFVPLRPTRIKLRQYEGVRMSKVPDDGDTWDWVLLLILLLYGGLPGVLWWCFAFQRDQFYVGLLQHHGSVTLELYRGWDQAVAKDMAKVIRDVGGYL